jgi:tRNA-dihydrouridine synthase A
MIDWTDRHCRYFLRQISRRARLYTEMISTGAILHGDAERHLRFDAEEHPLALQLGGADPEALARCSEIGADWGYDEINLNCGCPSDRVQGGGFGACLMREPQLVADCVRAMISASSVPVTVKCRIGVDDCDEESFLRRFIDDIADAGCRTVIIHARKAWLAGLSPKENREIPPLNYPLVHAIAREHPELSIIINGGFTDLTQVSEQWAHCAGVMLGRAVYDNPWLLAGVDPLLSSTNTPPSDRRAVIEAMRPYIERETQTGTPLHCITRHMLGLYKGLPGARGYRRVLSESARATGAGLEVIDAALRELATASNTEFPSQPITSEVHP